MEKDIFDKVLEKDFFELTDAELSELSEVCSSEMEYEQLKQVLKEAKAIKAETHTTKIETKEKLDNLFAQKHPKAAPIWYNSVWAVLVQKDKPFYRQPLLQVAAVILLVFLVVPFLNNHLENQTIQLARVEDKAPVNDVEEVEPATEEVVEKPATEELLEKEEKVNDTKEVVPQNFQKTTPVVSSMDNEVVQTSSRIDDGFVVESTHPDGVFVGEIVDYSIAASEEPELFDLLTATF